MNQFAQILNETLNDIMTETSRDRSKIDAFEGNAIPIIFRGWQYQMDLEKTKPFKMSVGHDLKLIERFNLYNHSVKREVFKMNFVLPLPHSYSNWVLECLNMLKEDSLWLEQLKATQIGFSEHHFRFGAHLIKIIRTREKPFSRLRISWYEDDSTKEWFENNLPKEESGYDGYSLKESFRDFLVKHFSNEKRFYSLPCELRDLIIHE